MNVMPIKSTKPDKIIRFLNCNAQYKKNNPFKIKNKGINKVSTDKTGKTFGAKKGRT
jgi:hypothetical protein